MAVIIEERGRGKFKPAPDYAVDEVKELLNAKIEEERQAFADCSEDISLISSTMIQISGTCCRYFRDAVVWIWDLN